MPATFDNALRGVTEPIHALDRMEAGGEEVVSWVERSDAAGRYAINAAPYAVAETLRAALFRRARSAECFTSATILAAVRRLRLLRETLGIDQSTRAYVAPSPFDYRKQALLYTAPPRCDPKNPRFAQIAAPIVEEILDITKSGRAFVLFTSVARLRENARSLARSPRVSDQGTR